MKKILILGGGSYYTRVIKNIKELGYFVLCIDKNPDAPGFELADASAAIDIVDTTAVYEYAKSNNVDGVMAINDFGTRAAFYTCQKLGLVSPSYLTAICGNNKGLMRYVWLHEGLKQPRFYIFGAKEPHENIAEKVGFPMVIKPTDSGGGGRGISIANDLSELSEAISHASTYVKNNQYVAEEYIEGLELTVDCIVYQGVVYPLAMSDKSKPESKYRVATSLNFPAAISEEQNLKVGEIVTKATEAMGISNGFSHTELIISGNGEIYLIEMGVRGGGGHVFSTIVELVSGINAPQELAKILCGDIPSFNKVDFKNGKSFVTYRFFNPKGTGVITDIKVDKSIVNSPNVVDFDITTKIGDRFDGLVDSLKRVGFVITKASDRETALEYAGAVEDAVAYEIDELNSI